MSGLIRRAVLPAELTASQVAQDTATSTRLADKTNVLNGDALIGVKLAQTGSIARTQHDRNEDTISVRDFPGTFNGVADDTSALQAAVNAVSAGCLTVDLAGRTLAITTVNVPNATPVRVQNGRLIVIGAGSLGLSKRTTVSPQSGGTFARYDLTVENVQFERSVSGGACVDIKLAWQDATAGVVIGASCNFQLKNGAVGVRASRSFFNVINGRFNMDATSTGFLCDASEVVASDAYPSCPFVSTFGQGSFTGGIGFDQVFVAGSNWNAFEGFTFSAGWTFYASLCRASKYNFLQFSGTHMVSARTVLDGGSNTVITGGYWDRQAGEGPILTLQTTVRNIQQVTIGGGVQFNAQLTAGDLILITDAGTASNAQATNVTIDNVLYIGGSNSSSTPIVGVHCDHALLRNLNVTQANSFQFMYACLNFTKAVSRSTIRAFEARDVSWYCQGVTTGYGTASNYNRFDGVYKVFDLVELIVPTYINSAVADILSTILPFESMMRPPVATVSGQLDPFGAGYFDMTIGSSYRNCVVLKLRKNASAPGSTRGGQFATVTLDASQYVAPL